METNSSNNYSGLVPRKDYNYVRDKYFALDCKFKAQKSHAEALEKKNTALSDEKRELKARVKELEKELRLANKEIAQLKETFSDGIALKEENVSLAKENKDLKKALNDASKSYANELEKKDKEHKKDLKKKEKEYSKELKKKDDEILRLKKQVFGLEVSKKKDFTNSSSPSSSKPQHKKIFNNRKKTGRKPGGQPGHEGHKRTAPKDDKPPIEVKPKEEILDNPDFKPTNKVITKVVVGVAIVPIVQTFQGVVYRNQKTGERVYPIFPPNVVNEVNYAESMKTLIFLLLNVCRVPVRKVAQIIKVFTQGELTPSTGFIQGINKEFSAKSNEEKAEILRNLYNSDCLYIDNTGSRVNGEGRNVTVIANNYGDVEYLFGKHKGHESIKDTFLKDFEGTLVHDHDKSFYSYGGSHQECLAHLLRYLKGVMDFEKDREWAPKMHALLQEMIATRNENDGILDEETIKDFEERYDKIVAEALKSYADRPPESRYSNDGFLLSKRFDKYKDATLYFLRHPNVATTNNRAERLLRLDKMLFKQKVTLRSDDSGKILHECLGVLQSMVEKDKPLYDTLNRIFARTKPKPKVNPCPEVSTS